MLSYGKLGVTIYLALTLSLFTVGISYKLFVNYEARVLASQLEVEATAMAKQLEYQALVAKRERAIRQAKQNKSRSKVDV